MKRICTLFISLTFLPQLKQVRKLVLLNVLLLLVAFTLISWVGYAQLPATNINIAPNGNTSSLTFHWTGGGGANAGRVVVITNATGSYLPAANQAVAGTAFPADAAGADLDTDPTDVAAVVYNGAGTSVTVTGLSPNVQYHVYVYDYTGSLAVPTYILANGLNNPVRLRYYTEPVDPNFVVPANVNSIVVQAWGGGGGGGGINTDTGEDRAGGGGSGGTYQKSTVAVTPSASITMTVGAGGTSANNSDGTIGATSTFNSTIPVSAVGGNPGILGLNNSRTGAGGAAPGGTPTFNGGAGAEASPGDVDVDATGSGGGGGSPGIFGSGGQAGTNGAFGFVGIVAGAAGSGGGAVGGAGVNTVGVSAAGNLGGFPGAGGSGAWSDNIDTEQAGGFGGDGLIIVSYSVPPSITSATLNYGTGVFVVTLSEPVTSLTNVDATKFHINNTTGSDLVTLSELEETSFTGNTITFTLNATNRLAALAVSGTPGGAGVAVVLDVDAGGVTTAAPNLIDDNNTVTETADTVVPTVLSVSSSTANGTYNAPDVIAVTVTFSEVVNVTLTPRIELETNTVNQFANYASGTGTATLTFNYTVQAGDGDNGVTDLTEIVNTLALNGGTITDVAGAAGVGNAANLAHPGGSLATLKDIKIDTTVPAILTSTITPNTGFRKIGDLITITLTAGGAETGLTAGAGTLINGQSAGFSESPAGTYNFTYTVGSGHTDWGSGALLFNVELTDGANTVAQTTIVNTLVGDANAPTNQNTVFTPSRAVDTSGSNVTIVSSGDTNNNVWFAPAGVTDASTLIVGPTMQKALNGLAVVIPAPTTLGDYKLYVVDAAGNISAESTATLSVFTQASNLTFAAAGTPASQINMSWTGGTGSDGRVVIIKTIAGFVNGGNYPLPDGFDPAPAAISLALGANNSATDLNGAAAGVAQVVFEGNTTGPITVTALAAATNYTLEIYEYKGAGASRVYLRPTYTVNRQTPNGTNPTVAATAMTFTSIGANTITVQFTQSAANTGTSSVLVARAGAAVTFVPTDGVSYPAGLDYGAGVEVGTATEGNKVIAYRNDASAGTPIIVSGLLVDVVYHFAVYGVNHTGASVAGDGSENYSTVVLNGNRNTEPSIESSGLTFTGISETGMTLNWSGSGNGDGRIVIMRSGAAVATDPTDYTTYTASGDFNFGNSPVGSAVGAGYVVYDGTGSSVALTELLPNTTYHFQVFEYNNTTSQGVPNKVYLNPGAPTAVANQITDPDITQPALLTVGTLTPGPAGTTRVQAGYLNSTNTNLTVRVPLTTTDGTLDGGSIQIRIQNSITTGFVTVPNSGLVAIASADRLAGFKDVVVAKTDLALAVSGGQGFAEGLQGNASATVPIETKFLQVTAVVTDFATNPRTYNQSVVDIDVDQTPPTVVTTYNLYDGKGIQNGAREVIIFRLSENLHDPAGVVVADDIVFQSGDNAYGASGISVGDPGGSGNDGVTNYVRYESDGGANAADGTVLNSRLIWVESKDNNSNWSSSATPPTKLQYLPLGSASVLARVIRDAAGNELGAIPGTNVVSGDVVPPALSPDVMTLFPRAGNSEKIVFTLTEALSTLTTSNAVTGFSTTGIFPDVNIANATYSEASPGVCPCTITLTSNGNALWTSGTTVSYQIASGNVLDLAGVPNELAAITNHAVVVETVKPVVTVVSIPDVAMKVGSTPIVTITTSDDDGDDPLIFAGSNIGGFALTGISSVSPTSKTATFTVTEGGTNVAAGSNIPLSVTLIDGQGNQQTTAFTTAIVGTLDAIDAVSPTITSITNTLPLIYEGALTQTVTVVYSEPMNTAVQPPILLSGGLFWGPQTPSGGTNGWVGNTYTATFTHLTGVNQEKVLGITSSVAAGGAQDAAGNPNLGALSSTTSAFDLDNQKPLISTITTDINQVTVLNNVIRVSVKYNESMLTSSTPAINFTAGTFGVGVPVAGGGYTNGWTTTDVLNDTYRRDFTNVTTEEFTNVIVSANGATDANGNVQTVSAGAAPILVDRKSPLVSSVNRVSSTPNNSASLVWQVVFDEPVFGVDPSDFSVTITQDPTLITSGVSSVSPVSSTIYNVTVSGVSGNGDLRLDVKTQGGGATIVDNYNSFVAGFTGGQIIEVDQIPPTYVSITRQSAINAWSTTGGTSAGTVIFRLNFDEPVTGIEYSGPNNNAFYVQYNVSVASISGAPATTGNSVDMTFNTVSGEGAYGLWFRENDDVFDLAGNPVNGPGFSEFYWSSPGVEYYTKVFPEPANNVAALSVTSITNTSVTLQWNTPDVFPSQNPTHFLVMAKPTVGGTYPLETFSGPDEDGDYIIDGAFAQNILRTGAVSQSATFSNLSSGVNYDFIIYPYTLRTITGTGQVTDDNIDYNTTAPATTTGAYPGGVPVTTAQASTMVLNSSNVVVSSILNDNTPGVDVLQFRVFDDSQNPLSPNSINLNLNSTSQETIVFNLSGDLTLSEGASLTGFTTSPGTILSAIYTGKGSTNTVTLTSVGNANWSSATTVSYSSTTGNVQFVTIGKMQSIVAHAINQVSDVVTYSSSGFYTVPAGITSLTVETWGAGGAGGAGAPGTYFDGGGGGGGGGYSRSLLAVTPSTLYGVTVGFGGTGSASSNGTPGGTSNFGGLVSSPGGSGGFADNGSPGPGGNGGGFGIGDVVFSGGAGGDGNWGGTLLPAAFGGGGGSSAGTSANGSSGFGDPSGLGTGGIAPSGGGDGGSGAQSGTGILGSVPGGGGGGSGNGAGGNGANGRVRVSYTQIINPVVSDLAADNAPFKFNQLVISQQALTGNSDPIDDWTQIIAGAELSDGVNPPLVGSVAGSTITFGSGGTIPSTNSGDFGYIGDAVSSASFKDYTLKIWLLNPLSNTLAAQVDNLILGFAVAPGGFTLNNASNNQASSRFLATQSPLNSSNAIDVDASILKFQAAGSSSPTDTNPQSTIGVATPFSANVAAAGPIVYALDANNNLDLDFAQTGNIDNPPGPNLAPSISSQSFIGGILNLKAAGLRLNAEGTNNLRVQSTGVTQAMSTLPVTTVITNTTTIAASASLNETGITISSLSNTLAGAVANFDFTITDDAVANSVNYSDNDGLPTQFNKITITQGTGNDPVLTTWTDAIAGAELSLTSRNGVVVSQPVTTALNVNVLASSIEFNSIAFGSGNPGRVNDGEYNVYTLKIYLKNPVDVAIRDLIDNADFVFNVSETSFNTTQIITPNSTSLVTASNTNSGNNNNAVIVTATQLDFITQWVINAPQSYDAALSPSPMAKARDANQNLDTDWSTGNGKSGAVVTAAPVTYPLANSAVTLTNGVLTFDPALQVTSAGNGTNGGVTSLVLSSTGLTNGTSNTFTLNYSGNSDIVRDHTTYPFSHPTNVLYAAANNQVTDITAGTGIAVEQFTIRDGGSGADTDGTSTKLSSIVLNIENYQLLRRVALYDGATEVADLPVVAPNISNVTATNADMTFSGITNFIVTDDLTKNLTVKVSFNSSSIPDNAVINFSVVSVTASGISSTFTGGASTTQPALGVNENQIEVVATQIDFTTQPSATNISTFADINSPYIVVEARDANANRDLDYGAAVGTISNTGTTGTGPGSELLMNNIPTGNFVNGVFSFQNFDIANSPNTFQFLENSGAEPGQLVQLTVPSGALTAGTSSTFQVIGSYESWMYFDPTFTYTTQIDFVPFQNATTSNTSLALGRVILSDGGSPGSSVNPGGTKNLAFGSHNDTDGAFTKIDDFTISLTNSADIRAIGLYTVGGTLIKEISNPGATVTFNTLSGFPAPDNDAITYVIRAEFKSTIIDQHQITMQITNVTPNSGSKFPEDNPITPAPTIAGISGGDASPIAQNILNVIATSLDFEDATFTTTQPSAFAGKQEPIDGSAGASPGGNTGIVYARDKFGLIDTDFNSVATVTAPATAISYPNVFINGKLDLTGMQYQNAGDGTLNVTATGSNSILLDSDIAGVGNIGNSTPSITVDVIHVTAVDDQNTVEQQTSLKGGTTNKRIFGLNFFAEHKTTTEPELSGFSIIFRDDDGNPYPYTKSATDNVYKNFKLFVAEGTGAPTALSEGTDYILTEGQTVALSSTNPPADYKDKLTFVLTNPVPLYQSNYRFYLNVDIDVNVSVGTPPITPYLVDLGYNGPNTNGHIVTSVGSSSTITDDATDDFVKGITRKFASTKPPVLVSTTPSSGTLNVDPDLNTISLKFDVPVVTFDGVINVYNRETGTLRAVFTSTNGKYVDGPALKDQVVVTLDFAAPVGFNFKADTVYYVTVEKGVFSNTDATQRKGISDEGFNLYGGISYSGTFYFKGSSLNAPVLSGTDATKYYFTPTTATFNFKFNEPGKVHYMVVHPTLPAIAPLTVTNDQILGNTPYTTSTIISRGTTTIDQLSPNLQFATINANLTNNIDYYVYVFAENDAQPLPISTSSPYGSSTNAFAVGTAGPTLKIKKTSANTGPYSNPRFEICPNSSVKMEEPIIISEAAGNTSDFSAGFSAGATQTFNILLPTGFQYDVTKPPTISFNGTDFGSLPGGTNVLNFKNSTFLEINFVNNPGGGSSDNIIISNLYLLSSAADIGGNIVRYGGTGLTTVPDDRVLARITSGAAASIPFTSSYDQAFLPWPYAQIANALPYKPVTYVPDNFASTVKLIPTPPLGDYGASFFTGSGLTNDELTLSAVTVDASFNITLTHTDQNGCATTTIEQYLVYDHSNAIPELLEVELPGVSYAIDETKIGLIPGTPDPVTNIPGLPNPTFNVNDLVSHIGLAGYQLIDLYSDIPVRTKGSGQVLDYDSPGWTGLVNSIKILNTSYPDANLGQTFKSYNWEYSNLINRNSTTTAGVEYPYDPAGRFARIIQSSGTGNGKTFFEAGSLGIIEFTGVYQSTADFSVFVPFRQEIELFIPAVPIVEVSGESSKAGETAIFCESGLPFTVIGYPLATSSDVTGFFTLRDSVSGAVIVDPGFVDNDNGTATFNPTRTVLKNGYKTIKIEYTFQQNNSPAIGTGAFYIRVTPNPVANFITSTLCEDIDVVFTDTTLDPIPGDVTISEWLWSFGDASSAQNIAIIKDPIHVYAATGLYANVNLRVKTNYGCASVAPKTVDLEIGGTPSVDFTFNGVSTADPINFTNASVVSPNDSFQQLDWTFGDGNAQAITSGFVSTSHNYTLPNSYDVNLKVTTTIGCVSDSTQRIIVLSRATPTSSTPYLENFETNNGMWQPSSLPTRSYGTNPSSWAVGTPTPSVITISDDPATFGNGVVKTSLTGSYYPFEKSAWYSPSFDISQLSRPMVSFNNFTQMEISDGVVLQYSTDNKNVADPTKIWWALGQQGEGVDWFTAQGITAKPGNQPDKDFGWSDFDKTKWLESKHALSNESGKDLIVGATKVVFRFALASVDDIIETDGFALDNFRLGERTRTILLENFTTTDGPNLANIKSENEFIKGFESAGLGTTVVKLNYHIGFTGTDPFNLDNPADPSARALYYNVKNVPYAFLDGARTDDATINPAFASWGQRAYDTQTLQLGQADITVPTPIVGADGSIKFDVQVKALYNLPDNTVLHVAVIEKSILASSLSQVQREQINTGETTLDYVLKKMLPNASGTKFGTALAKDQSRTFTGFEYYPDASKLYTTKDDLEIIVFLQDENRIDRIQNIYQTELITGILDPPVVTGLENTELLANMEVYPNPANNEFTIQLPGVAKQSMELQLVDQVGKVVTKDSIKEGTSRKTINSQDLAAGIYILQIGSGKSGVVRKKILIVHQD